MLIRLLSKQQAVHVKEQFDLLELALGHVHFNDLFDVCLTDYGSEFSDIKGLEQSIFTQEKRMNLYFCNPMRCDQKGALERNHRFIRKILPKGTSFEGLTLEDFTNIQSHINSYKRKSLKYKSPYSLFKDYYGEKICTLLDFVR